MNFNLLEFLDKKMRSASKIDTDFAFGSSQLARTGLVIRCTEQSHDGPSLKNAFISEYCYAFLHACHLRVTESEMNKADEKFKQYFQSIEIEEFEEKFSSIVNSILGSKKFRKDSKRKERAVRRN